MVEPVRSGHDRGRHHLPKGLVEQLTSAVPPRSRIRPDRVERGRRHQRYRTFDNRDVVNQVATELLKVSAPL